MSLMGLRFRLGFALHLQTMLLQLLRVDRLFGALALLRVFRPPLAAIRTICAVRTATATAAAIAPAAARFFALRARRTIAVLGTGVRTLLHRRPGLLLLRSRLARLIGPSLALGLLLTLLRNFSTRLLAPRLFAPRLFALRLFAARAFGTRLLLLRRALVALLVTFCVAVAALLRVRTTAAAIALLVPATFATSTASIASATPASATFAAPVLVPVARFVTPAFGTLRPGGMNRRFVCRGRLLGGLVGLEPAKQEAENSRTRGFRCRDGGRGGGRHRRCR